MPKVLHCPFFKWEKKLAQYCEAARVCYPSRTARTEYQGLFCASADGWRKCTLAQEMCREYERRDQKCSETARKNRE